MLGGGVFITQNKILPGSYINFVSATNPSPMLGERGVVAMILPTMNQTGSVYEVTPDNAAEVLQINLAIDYNDKGGLPFREIFRHAQKIYVYDPGADEDVDNSLDALEAYEFNTLVLYGNYAKTADYEKAITKVKYWRDEMGKKCQVVVYNEATPDYEGVVNVVSKPTKGNDYALTAWVAGALANCAVNKSCTNMKYDGELNIDTNKTQKQLEDCITNGQFAFHLVYGDVCVLEDINSLTTVTDDKGVDFKSNQTIRVTDQIANDMAKLFNTKYLGKIANNASGRANFWGECVAYFRELENLGAIENFDASQLTVAQGNTKKAVVVNCVVNVVNAMAQLYMTVVVQ